MTSVTLLLPLPPRALSPNARPHWATHYRTRTDYRELVAWHAFVQLGGVERRMPRFVSATATVFYIVGNRAGYGDRYRPRDADNALASFKSGIDGLVDCGLLAADDAEHLSVRCCLVRAEMAGGLVAVHIEGETA